MLSIYNRLNGVVEDRILDSQHLSCIVALDECTQSTHRAVDAERVAKFCAAVDKDLDGPSTAARLLGHKIQSPQQQESLNALSVCICLQYKANVCI